MGQNNGGDYTKGFVFGALIGGVVGAVTALLLAPKSGAELRKELAEKSTDMYDKAQDYLSDVQENFGDAVHTTVNEGRIRAQNIIDSAKNQAAGSPPRIRALRSPKKSAKPIPPNSPSTWEPTQ